MEFFFDKCLLKNYAQIMYVCVGLYSDFPFSSQVSLHVHTCTHMNKLSICTAGLKELSKLGCVCVSGFNVEFDLL